jgi:muramoyltetrapeptide carboxypeptidase LdcA involved in peptidoglycan recycling
MIEMIKPRALRPGDRVAASYALKDIPWLAAHPEARAGDSMEVLRDPSIQGIISTIGGDDSIRMLPFLDYSVIRDNPKVFLGYSDSQSHTSLF